MSTLEYATISKGDVLAALARCMTMLAPWLPYGWLMPSGAVLTAIGILYWIRRYPFNTTRPPSVHTYEPRQLQDVVADRRFSYLVENICYPSEVNLHADRAALQNLRPWVVASSTGVLP